MVYQAYFWDAWDAVQETDIFGHVIFLQALANIHSVVFLFWWEHSLGPLHTNLHTVISQRPPFPTHWSRHSVYRTRNVIHQFVRMSRLGQPSFRCRSTRNVPFHSHYCQMHYSQLHGVHIQCLVYISVQRALMNAYILSHGEFNNIHLALYTLSCLKAFWQIAAQLLYMTKLIQLMKHTSAGRGVSGTDLVGCASSLDIRRAKGGCTPRL